MPIPAFTIDNILPPFVGPNPAGPSSQMSPYEVSVSEVTTHFASMSDRSVILTGWLEYRIALRSIGIKRGFQWLDGSFMENKSAPPNDLDIVVFFHRPADYKSNVAFTSIWNTNIALFDRNTVKAKYLLDVFHIDLDGNTENIVLLTTYYLQLFSHQRSTGLWKGMIEVRQEDSLNDAALLASL